jgi:hypothetical protein
MYNLATIHVDIGAIYRRLIPPTEAARNLPEFPEAYPTTIHILTFS